MNICDKDEEKIDNKIPKWVEGHLYKWIWGDYIYLATNEGRLVNITTGHLYDLYESQFSTSTFDVTEQYCLQKVK